jgi:hypothetical protein
MKAKILLAVLSLISLAGFYGIVLGQSGPNLPPLGNYYGPYATGTTPVNGTDAVMTLTLSSTANGGGTFTVAILGGYAHITLTGTETNTVVATDFQNAIGALPQVNGTANFPITSGTGSSPVILTGSASASGILRNLAITQWVPAVTSGTLTLTGTTSVAGVNADGRYLPPMALIYDLGDLKQYQNASKTVLSPTWNKVSGQ